MNQDFTSAVGTRVKVPLVSDRAVCKTGGCQWSWTMPSCTCRPKRGRFMSHRLSTSKGPNCGVVRRFHSLHIRHAHRKIRNQNLHLQYYRARLASARYLAPDSGVPTDQEVSVPTTAHAKCRIAPSRCKSSSRRRMPHSVHSIYHGRHLIS